jgi:hypothetical protein
MPTVRPMRQWDDNIKVNLNSVIRDLHKKEISFVDSHGWEYGTIT